MKHVEAAEDPSPFVGSGASSSSDISVVSGASDLDDLTEARKDSSLGDGVYGWNCIYCSFIVHFLPLGTYVPQNMIYSEQDAPRPHDETVALKSGRMMETKIDR